MEGRKDIAVNERKKVLFLVNIPSPYRVEFFEELGKLCELTVLYEKQSADDRQWKYIDKTNYTSVFMKGIKTGADNALCFEVVTHLKKKYDVIVVGGYSTPTGMLAIEYLRLKKIPFYLNCDGGFIKQEKKISFIIKKHFIGSATYWLSSGKETNKYLKHYGAKEDKIFLYPFSSVREKDVMNKPLTEEDKNLLKKELGIIEEKVVVSVGRFVYGKGFDLLIKASSNINSNVGIYIIGGEPTQEYIRLINEYQVKNIHFVGFSDKETLNMYYRVADCMAFPTRSDVWGLVINEAMANGLPIVSTDKCIAALEIVNDAGYIVPSDDVNSLYMAINNIIENPSIQKNMSEKALKKAKEYTIEHMANMHITIFDKETRGVK